MVNTKRILTVARKLQKKPSGVVDKGHFVIYTMDKRRFVIPLSYLSDSIFLELLKMSEEEFGLSSDGPIIFPCDSVFMNYVVLLIQQGLAKDLEKDVLNSLHNYPCSSCSTSFFHGGDADEEQELSLVCRF